MIAADRLHEKELAGGFFLSMPWAFCSLIFGRVTM
jgi:hypothetical protein